MAKNLQPAITAVEMAYDEIIQLATDIVDDMTGDVDSLIESATQHIENLGNDAIRDLLLRLSLKAYSFSAVKDKAAFKATLAETLRKEAYANAFGTAEGTVATKENLANLAISSEIVVEQVYQLAANLFKTKLDQVHRVVDTLKSVLMSRMQEAKLINTSDAVI